MKTKAQEVKIRPRSRYSERLRVKTKLKPGSRTKQSFKAECDINNIMRKYRDTGIVTHTRDSQPMYGDFSEITDYQGSLNQVLQAQEAFEQLPSLVRKRFANDPGKFVEFIQDDKNYDEAMKLGLLDPEKTKHKMGKEEPKKKEDTKPADIK